MKRKIISTITLLMLIAQIILPSVVNATNKSEDKIENGATTIQNTVSANNGDLEMGGNGSFGTLLAESINEQSSEDSENNQAGIISAEIDSNIATVKYYTYKKATIIVAIYNEEKNKLITTEKQEVDIAEEETEILIEFQENLPQYFFLKVFMIDKEKNPICSVYENSTYTEEMQKLLAMTIDDYEADRVLNIDDRKDTNFAIYNEETIIVNAKESGVTSKSADEENKIYVFENINDQIKNLKSGDIVSYVIDEEQEIIVKVSDIRIDGNTATITGEDLKIDEVFDYVKIETDTSEAQFEVTESQEEGITYVENNVDNERSMFGIDAEAGFSKKATFLLNLLDLKNEDDNEESDEHNAGEVEGNLSVKITGQVDIETSVSLKFYLTSDETFIEYDDKIEITFSGTISGQISIEIPLATGADLYFHVGSNKKNARIIISYVPKFVVEVEGALTLSASFEKGQNIKVNSGKITKTDLPMKSDANNLYDFKASFFIGFKWEPTIKLEINKKIFSAEIGIKEKMGIDITASYGTDIEDQTGGIIHDCETCFDGEIDGVLEGSIYGKLSLFETEFNYERRFSIERKITNFYISSKHGAGFGRCPGKEYEITFNIIDKDGNGVAGAIIEIISSSGIFVEASRQTGSEGIVFVYLRDGNYSYVCEYQGKRSLQNLIEVDGEPLNVTFNIEEIKDTYEGQCGDNAYYKLYNDDGLLHISGTGKLWDGIDENYNVSHPWGGVGNVQKVVVDEGIIDLGNGQFMGEKNLSEIILPNSLERIGDYDFEHCTKLAMIDIPDNVKEIGNYAFYDLIFLSGVKIPSKIEIIGNHAFYNTPITEVTVPKSCKEIGDSAFYNCDYLENISIACKEVGHSAFRDCDNIKSLKINEGVEKIDDLAFEGCKIDSIDISDGLRYIGKQAFESCEFPYEMSNLIIPSSVETIEERAFSVCGNLDKVSIAGKYISDYAFSGTDMNTLEILGSVEFIGHQGIGGVHEEIIFRGDIPDFSWAPIQFVQNLTRVYYPNTWEEIPECLKKLGDTITLIPYDINTSISYNEVLDEEKLANSIYNKENSKNINKVSQISFNAKINKYLSKYVGTSEEIENSNEKTSKFTGLVANENYIIYVIKEENTNDMLSNENLLYIDQSTADENGEISFTYIPKEETENIVVLLYGKESNKEVTTYLTGDVNNDGKLNIKDWNMVYNHINETSKLTYEEFERGDVNKDGKVNIKDWNRMYDHITEVNPLW